MKSFFALGLTLAAGFALAQAPQPTYKVEFAKPAKPGVVSGVVNVKLPAGWHAYGKNPDPKVEDFNTYLTLEIGKQAGLKDVKISYPKPVAKGDTYIYEGTVAIKFEFVSTNRSAIPFEFKVTHQLCTDSTCVPPKTDITKARPGAK